MTKKTEDPSARGYRALKRIAAEMQSHAVSEAKIAVARSFPAISDPELKEVLSTLAQVWTEAFTKAMAELTKEMKGPEFKEELLQQIKTQLSGDLYLGEIEFMDVFKKSRAKTKAKEPSPEKKKVVKRSKS
jgi:thioredoxin-like negative regulator of GroEL